MPKTALSLPRFARVTTLPTMARALPDGSTFDPPWRAREDMYLGDGMVLESLNSFDIPGLGANASVSSAEALEKVEGILSYLEKAREITHRSRDDIIRRFHKLSESYGPAPDAFKKFKRDAKAATEAAALYDPSPASKRPRSGLTPSGGSSSPVLSGSAGSRRASLAGSGSSALRSASSSSSARPGRSSILSSAAPPQRHQSAIATPTVTPAQAAAARDEGEGEEEDDEYPTGGRPVSHVKRLKTCASSSSSCAGGARGGGGKPSSSSCASSSMAARTPLNVGATAVNAAIQGAAASSSRGARDEGSVSTNSTSALTQSGNHGVTNARGNHHAGASHRLSTGTSLPSCPSFPSSSRATSSTSSGPPAPRQHGIIPPTPGPAAAASASSSGGEQRSMRNVPARQEARATASGRGSAAGSPPRMALPNHSAPTARPSGLSQPPRSASGAQKQQQQQQAPSSAGAASSSSSSRSGSSPLGRLAVGAEGASPYRILPPDASLPHDALMRQAMPPPPISSSGGSVPRHGSSISTPGNAFGSPLAVGSGSPSVPLQRVSAANAGKNDPKLKEALKNAQSTRANANALQPSAISSTMISWAKREILHTLNQPAALSNLHDALNSQPETPRCACKNELIDLLARTLDGIENVSTLIVGPRGAGKHRLLSSVLRQFAESSAAQGASSYADPAAAGSSSSNKLDGHGFLRVDLHPMLVPDEPTALMAIASQLRVSGLEHSKGSFCDGLRYLLHLLRRARPGASGDDAVEGQSQPVVFVLHSFESFCQRPKQTLLYSLFDLMQTEDAQMAVIGLTTRMDVAELLEKRVRSRAGHRQMWLPALDHPADCQRLLTTALQLPEVKAGDSPNMLRDTPEHARRFCEAWAANTAHLCAQLPYSAILKRRFSTGVTPNQILTALRLTLSSLSSAQPERNFVFIDPFDSNLKTMMVRALSLSQQQASPLPLHTSTLTSPLPLPPPFSQGAARGAPTRRAHRLRAPPPTMHQEVGRQGAPSSPHPKDGAERVYGLPNICGRPPKV